MEKTKEEQKCTEAQMKRIYVEESVLNRRKEENESESNEKQKQPKKKQQQKQNTK